MIANELRKENLDCSGFLSFAKKLIDTPSLIDDSPFCIQNVEPDSDGNFVCAVAHRWNGKRYLVVYRFGDVWFEGLIFLVRPQD